jgi:Holliday junction resolvase RusA-like endonuclease
MVELGSYEHDVRLAQRQAVTDNLADIAKLSARTDFVHAVIPGPPPPMPRPRSVLVPTMSTRPALALAHRARSLQQLYALFRASVYSGGHGSPIERWKSTAGALLRDAKHRAGYGTRPILPQGEPLEVLVLVVQPLAKSRHRKTPAKQPRRTWATKGGKGGGDWDNFGKPICDAANGILWVDDAQVARGMVEKVVAAQGEPPRLEVIATPLWDEASNTVFERRLTFLNS